MPEKIKIGRYPQPHRGFDADSALFSSLYLQPDMIEQLVSKVNRQFLSCHNKQS